MQFYAFNIHRKLHHSVDCDQSDANPQPDQNQTCK